MSNNSRRCLFVCLIVLLSSAVTMPGEDSPLSGARFSPDAKMLYAAASQSTPSDGTDVSLLDDEETYVYDASGSRVYTEYLVYKVLTQKGAEDWDSISVDWEPWHDKRPTLRARVITPDFVIHELDPKTIADAPAQDESSDVYSDGRVMRAPLPAIAPGSVVEQEVIVSETAPFFGAGTAARSFFGRVSVPTRHSRLTLDAPSSLPLRYSAQLLPDFQPQRTERDGRVQLLFERGPMEASEEAQPNLPSDVPAYPSVAFSTGESWERVATEYEKIVDSHIVSLEVKPLVDKLTRGKNTRTEKAQALLEYLDKEIRYTGVEFADAAIVPHSPGEILAHKYGDCKDKAALLVAMLRASGIPAYVALLNAGSRLDVPADLPGMGLFDHAIVYAPGEPDLWIDATDEYAKLGQLPGSDQGRLALVAHSGSKALVRIPEASSRDNILLEFREIHLAENGPARVVETSEPRGVFESEYRSLYADQQNKKNHDDLASYVKDQYLAEKLDRLERSDPDDFSRQFRLVLESDKAKRGFTDLESAVAAIRLEGLFYRLPDRLQRKLDEESKDPEAEKERKRATDYQLPEAFVAEWQYTIVPPLGFQAKPLPHETEISLGPAKLTEHFETVADGSVHAVIRFDTTKRRYTVAEAKDLRNKVAELSEGDAILINFEPRASALLQQGKLRESFATYRSLIAQHPKEALHHLQIARAFLNAGMGDAARQEARAAVALEPKAALAEKTLAEILEYDLVGRKFRSGSDYTGAANAFREAMKLDPDDKTTAGDLAILLEYDEDGERYGAGAKLQDAVAEYKRLGQEKLTSMGLQSNLSFALFYAGQFADARSSAENISPQPKALLIACEAALNGSQAGITEANKLFSSESDVKNHLKSAGEMLMNVRLYPLAADLLQSGASGDNAAATMGLASTLRKTRRHEEIQFANTPRDVVKKFFLASLDPDLSLEKLTALASKNAIAIMKNTDPEDLKKTLQTGKNLHRNLARKGSSPQVAVDLVMGMAEPVEDGNDATGYRERIQIPGSKKMTLFVVKEDGKYKVLDTSEKPNAVGIEILDRVAANDLRGATTLLNWIREEQHLEGGDDPLSGDAFPRFWTLGKPGDAAQMKLAAAAMMVQTKPTVKQGVAILEDARKNPLGDAEKVNVEVALVIGYGNLEDYADELKIASGLTAQFPESRRAFLWQSFALRQLGKSTEADQSAQERLQRIPEDADAMRALVYNAIARNDYRTAYDLTKKIMDAGKAESNDWNEMAWVTLFFQRPGGPDLDAAIKASQLSQNTASILHTLGCIYAELGKTKEAREVLLQGMDILDLDEPNDDYWYAFGRIAEQFGEREIAASDYARLTKPKNATQIPQSTYWLAQARTQALREGEHERVSQAIKH